VIWFFLMIMRKFEKKIFIRLEPLGKMYFQDKSTLRIHLSVQNIYIF